MSVATQDHTEALQAAAFKRSQKLESHIHEHLLFNGEVQSNAFEIATQHRLDQRLAKGLPPVGDLTGSRPYPSFLEAWWHHLNGDSELAIDKCVATLERWNPGITNENLLAIAANAKADPNLAESFIERFGCSKPEAAHPGASLPHVVSSGIFTQQQILILEDPKTSERQGYCKSAGVWMPFDGITLGFDKQTHLPQPEIHHGKHPQDPQQWIATSILLEKLDTLLPFPDYSDARQLNETLSKHSSDHPALQNQKLIDEYLHICALVPEETIKQGVEFAQQQIGPINTNLSLQAVQIIDASKQLEALGIKTLLPSLSPAPAQDIPTAKPITIFERAASFVQATLNSATIRLLNRKPTDLSQEQNSHTPSY